MALYCVLRQLFDFYLFLYMTALSWGWSIHILLEFLHSHLSLWCISLWIPWDFNNVQALLGWNVGTNHLLYYTPESRLGDVTLIPVLIWEGAFVPGRFWPLPYSLWPGYDQHKLVRHTLTHTPTHAHTLHFHFVSKRLRSLKMMLAQNHFVADLAYKWKKRLHRQELRSSL